MQLKDLKKMIAFGDTSDVSDKRLTVSKALVFMNEFCNKVYDSFDQSRKTLIRYNPIFWSMLQFSNLMNTYSVLSV